MAKPGGKESTGLRQKNTGRFLWILTFLDSAGDCIENLQVSFRLVLMTPLEVGNIHLGRETADLRL